MQGYAGKQEIEVRGKVIDLYDRFAIIDAETVNRKTAKGKIKLYNMDGFALKIGDTILAKARPSKDEPPKFDSGQDLTKMSLSMHQYLFAYSNEYEVINEKVGLLTHIYNFRESVKARFEKIFPEDEANIAKALVFNDKYGFSPELKADVKAAGASHIFAISGQHLSIVSLGIMLMLEKICRQSKFKNAISIIFIITFTIIVGYAPALLRSCIMIVKYLSSLFFKKRDEPIDSVFFSSIVVLLIYPFAMFTPSFLLSYSAIIGILLLASPLSTVKSKWLKYASIILASLAAIAGTSIFTSYFYNANNLTSIWSSIALTPVVTLAMFGILLIAFVPFLQTLLAPATYFFLHAMNLLIKTFAKTSFMIQTGTPEFIHFIAYGFILYFLHVIIKEGVAPWLNARLKAS
ncbi:ComEC/Rec2 family competence protein [Treponema sp. R6D11]